MRALTTELIIKMAEQYKTPCFIYEADAIRENYLKLKNSLPSSVEIFYSAKANPAIALISEIYQMGTGLELCSYFEIEAAILAGVDPKDIIFVGPGKSLNEIEKCLNLGIYSIVCESESEFELISGLAEQRNQMARVALRINPLHTSKTAMLKMGGQSLQFGIDEEVILKKAKYFLEKSNVKITGIHVYHGSRILDAETIAENTKYILSLGEKFQKLGKCTLEFIDIGGGLGVPYFLGEASIDFQKFKELMNSEIQHYQKTYPKTKIILEVGRFLVANSGVFVSQIRDVKISRGVNIIVTDGGMNCFMAASNMGSLLNRNFNISLASKNCLPFLGAESYTITGPLCTPFDLMGRKVILPKAEIGDYILIHNAGAYGPTASPVMFLSQGFPSEILYKKGREHLIRSRFSNENFFQNQHLVQEV